MEFKDDAQASGLGRCMEVRHKRIWDGETAGGKGRDTGDNRKEEFSRWHAECGAMDWPGGMWLWSSEARSAPKCGMWRLSAVGQWHKATGRNECRIKREVS